MEAEQERGGRDGRRARREEEAASSRGLSDCDKTGRGGGGTEEKRWPGEGEGDERWRDGSGRVVK